MFVYPTYFCAMSSRLWERIKDTVTSPGEREYVKLEQCDFTAIVAEQFTRADEKQFAPASEKQFHYYCCILMRLDTLYGAVNGKVPYGRTSLLPFTVQSSVSPDPTLLDVQPGVFSGFFCQFACNRTGVRAESGTRCARRRRHMSMRCAHCVAHSFAWHPWWTEYRYRPVLSTQQGVASVQYRPTGARSLECR